MPLFCKGFGVFLISKREFIVGTRRGKIHARYRPIVQNVVDKLPHVFRVHLALQIRQPHRFAVFVGQFDKPKSNLTKLVDFGGRVVVARCLFQECRYVRVNYAV